MTTRSNSDETTPTAVFHSLLGDESSEIFAVGLDEQATKTLIEELVNLDESPSVQLLTRESVLKWVRDDFCLASLAADLIEAGSLSVRTSDEHYENKLIVTDGMVASIVLVDEYAARFVTDDAEFVASARDHWANRWTEADEFSLRTPGRSRVEDTLAAELGPDVQADFRTMLKALGTARDDEERLDEVGVSLLAAAKHEHLLYDVSNWGEDVGIASKATFSRSKNELEDRGLIDTEKVPIEVGRPRLRLVLGDERLRDADTDDLVSVAQELLSPVPA